MSSYLAQRARIAQRVPWKAIGAILMRVGVPGAAWDFGPRVDFQADSLSAATQPPCAIACIKFTICARVKNPEHWQPHQLRCTKILHTLIGMGSTALTAAMPYPGKATQISHMGQLSNGEKKSKWVSWCFTPSQPIPLDQGGWKKTTTLKRHLNALHMLNLKADWWRLKIVSASRLTQITSTISQSPRQF